MNLLKNHLGILPGKVLVVIMKDDYGKPEQGESYEHRYFLGSLREMFEDVRLFDFGPYIDEPAKLQPEVALAAHQFKADLIFFCLYTDQFEAETLDALKKNYTTVNWFCDDQWRQDFYDAYAPHFTHVITTDPMRGGDAILSQWATDRVQDGVPPDTYKYDVSFVGWRLPYREWFVKELENRGIHVECFGTGWPNGRRSYDEVDSIFRHSKINLNISNSRSYDARFLMSFGPMNSAKDREQIKGRHFEIGAAGGFQLTNYVDFLEDYLEIGAEVGVYVAVDDCERKIRWYLDHTEQRENIIEASQARIRQDHLYENRFRKILTHVALKAAA